MGNESESIDTLKRGMRRKAIVRRKQVGESERAQVGVRLGELGASFLSGLSDETNRFNRPASPNGSNASKRPYGPGRSDESDKSDSEDSTSGIEKVNDANGSNALCHIKANGAAFDVKPGDTAAAYISMGTEIPTLGLLDQLVKRRLRVLVPRLGTGRDIGWSEYAGESALREMPHTATGGLRPAEPDGRVLGPRALADAKIVFIPAFAIDLDGTRLGRGGGWYDRVLSLCRPDALKIGICWDFEFIDRHDAVPREIHDIAVDAVITDRRIITI